MCGIIGYYDFSEGGTISHTQLLKMRDTLAHRGPDGKGIFVSTNKKVGLGHRRLKIIDLSDNAAQPMFYESGRYVIVYNGEVYNYVELKKELLEKGYHFFSTSDTEVILKSFIEFGEKCVEKFIGMWAFAIYDRERDVLFISRDRFGIKPLFYYFDGDLFIFSSEIKGILKYRNIKRKYNIPAILSYIELGLLSGLKETFFKNIFRLHPGHNIVIKNNHLDITEYWKLENKERNSADKVKYLKNLLNNSIKLHLRSDVPWAILLSGGLDSTSILGLASKYSGNAQCYSTFFDIGGEYDESANISLVTSKFNMKSHLIEIELKNFLATLKEIIKTLDEPSPHTSIYPRWFLLKELRKTSKIALSGQGADEYFLGYPKAFNLLSDEDTLRHAVTTILTKLIPKPREEILIGRNLIPDETYNEHNKKLHVLSTNSNDKAKVYSFNLMFRGSLPELLRDEDMISMRYSVECRVPFLDHRIVEFVYSLPLEYKLKNGFSKYLLREVMDKVLPDEIVWNKKKIGYPVPFNIWIRENKDTLLRMISAGYCTKFKLIDKDKFKKLIDEMEKNPGYIRLIWRVLTLELWFEVNENPDNA